MATTTPGPKPLPGPLRARRAAAGFPAIGALDVADYDARVPVGWRSALHLSPGPTHPPAQTVLLLASAGPAFEAGMRRAGLWTDDGPTRDVPHPVDSYTRQIADLAESMLEEQGARSASLFHFDALDASGRRASPVQGGRFADFVALGEAAGLGAPGRLRLLLHPSHGPWLALRVLVLTSAALQIERDAATSASPCVGCAAPCADACPGAALAGGLLDLARCFATREEHPSCRGACAARRACVLGGDAAASPALERHYCETSLRFGATSVS